MQKIHVLNMYTTSGCVHQAAYFLGPDDGNFRELCKSLMEEAARLTLEKRKRNSNTYTKVDQYDTLEALCNLLCERGYDRIELPEATFWGGCYGSQKHLNRTGFSEDLKKDLKKHNDQARYEQAKNFVCISEIFETEDGHTEKCRKEIKEYEEKGFYEKSYWD